MFLHMKHPAFAVRWATDSGLRDRIPSRGKKSAGRLVREFRCAWEPRVLNVLPDLLALRPWTPTLPPPTR